MGLANDPMGGAQAAFRRLSHVFRIVTKAGAARVVGAPIPSAQCLPVSMVESSAAASGAPASVPPAASAATTARLVDQLQTLTELIETLALRVLELEERLLDQERQLQRDTPSAADADRRLLETERRLAQVEGLLQRQGRDSSSAS